MHIAVWIGLTALLAGCSAPGPPPGVTPQPLEPQWTVGQETTTTRFLTTAEDGPDGHVELTREDVYVTRISALDARGRPVAGIREVLKAQITWQDDQRADTVRAQLAGRVIEFRPDLPPIIDGQEADPDDVRGLTMAGFDDVFLPEEPVWEGASWEPSPTRLRELDRFLRQLGLTPDENSISITWTDTRDLPGGERGAVCAIDWSATGVIGGASPTGVRLSLNGELLFNLDQRMVTALRLHGAREATTGTGIARYTITLNRVPGRIAPPPAPPPTLTVPSDAPNQIPAPDND